MSSNTNNAGMGELTQYDEHTRDLGFESPLYTPIRDDNQKQIVFNEHISNDDESFSPDLEEDDSLVDVHVDDDDDCEDDIEVEEVEEMDDEYQDDYIDELSQDGADLPDKLSFAG